MNIDANLIKLNKPCVLLSASLLATNLYANSNYPQQDAFSLEDTWFQQEVSSLDKLEKSSKKKVENLTGFNWKIWKQIKHLFFTQNEYVGYYVKDANGKRLPLIIDKVENRTSLNIKIGVNVYVEDMQNTQGFMLCHTDGKQKSYPWHKKSNFVCYTKKSNRRSYECEVYFKLCDIANYPTENVPGVLISLEKFEQEEAIKNIPPASPAPELRMEQPNNRPVSNDQPGRLDMSQYQHLNDALQRGPNPRSGLRKDAVVENPEAVQHMQRQNETMKNEVKNVTSELNRAFENTRDENGRFNRRNALENIRQNNQQKRQQEEVIKNIPPAPPAPELRMEQPNNKPVSNDQLGRLDMSQYQHLNDALQRRN